MPNLTIKPKEKGSTIKFGKLPILTRSLTAMASMDDVVQLVVEGRYYAVELRKSPLEKALDEMKTKTEKPVEKPIDEEKLSKGLEELGFVNISSKPTPKPTVTRAKTGEKRNVDYSGNTLAQGNLSLFEWLKTTDYLVYKLFVYGNGQVSFKTVDYDDICLVFMDAGLADKRGQSRRNSGRSAQNVANMTVARLLNQGILQKIEEGGRKSYTLTMNKGGSYARGVYRTVSARTYDWDVKRGRVLHGEGI